MSNSVALISFQTHCSTLEGKNGCKPLFICRFSFFLKGGQLFQRLVSVSSSSMFRHFLYNIFSSSIYYVFLLSLIRNVVQSRPCKPQDFNAVAVTTIRNPSASFLSLSLFFFFVKHSSRREAPSGGDRGQSRSAEKETIMPL